MGTDERPVWSVALPAGAEPPYRVWVNGEPREEGVDYTVDGRWLRFRTPLAARARLGPWRRLLLLIGIGVYGDLRGDTVDLRYTAGGRPLHATDLPIIPPQAPAAPPPT
jgi:hypothetical protein